MKFQICTVDIYNNPSKIVAEYPCVNDFGFESEELVKTREFIRMRDHTRVKEQYTIKQPYVNIDSLDKLLEFCKTVGNPLIINIEDGVPEIEIYDGYRE